MREHNDAVNRLDFWPTREPITAEYPAGSTRDVELFDGGRIRLHKLDDDYDPSNKVMAMTYLESRRERGEVVTGLLYVRPDAGDMHDALDTVAVPLNSLSDADLVPDNAALASVNASLR